MLQIIPGEIINFMDFGKRNPETYAFNMNMNIWHTQKPTKIVQLVIKTHLISIYFIHKYKM